MVHALAGLCHRSSRDLTPYFPHFCPHACIFMQTFCPHSSLNISRNLIGQGLYEDSDDVQTAVGDKMGQLVKSVSTIVTGRDDACMLGGGDMGVGEGDLIG